MSKADRGAVVILCLAALFYACLLPFAAVGTLNDDALYILGAKSLLQVRYVSLYLRHQPPLNDPLPGFPLFLAPFVFIFEPHWNALKIVPWTIMVLSALMIWRLVRQWISQDKALILTAIFVFNPTVVFFSSALMSESCLLLISLLVFWLLVRMDRRQTAADGWLLGALMGWAALIRPQGISLVPAVLVALGLRRRWRPMGEALLSVFVIVGAVLGRNYRLTHSVTSYAGRWQAIIPHVLHADSRLLHNVKDVIDTVFWNNLLGLSLPDLAVGLSAIATLLGVAGLAFIGWGLLRVAYADKSIRAPVVAMAIYALGYFLIHLLWMAVSPRYLFPVLPILLLGLVEAAESLSRVNEAVRRGAFIALAFLAVFYAHQDVSAVQILRAQPADIALPIETLHWVRDHTPREAHVLAFRAPSVYLYSERFALSQVGGENAEEFRFHLFENGITHAVVEPFTALFVQSAVVNDPNKEWALTERWLQSWPQAFRAVYQNPTEKTTVYEILPDAAFRAAGDMYLVALKDFREQRFVQGFAHLDESLRIDPHLSIVRNAYGMADMLLNPNLKLAERQFLEALKLRPNYPFALLNLARVYRKMGEVSLAKSYYLKAAQAMMETGESLAMAPALEQEAAALPTNEKSLH